MFPVGFIAVALGLFVIDSVIRQRPILQSLKNMITDPKAFRQDNAALNGTAYTGSASSGGQGPGDALPSNSTNPVVQYAYDQVGKRYVWGAEGPNAFDCSGLSKMAYKTVGINLPHFSTAQASMGTAINASNPADWEPGDLLFPYPGHVAIYVGNGMVIEATNPSEGVIEDSAHKSYWRVRRYTYSGSSVGAMNAGLGGAIAHE